MPLRRLSDDGGCGSSDKLRQTGIDPTWMEDFPRMLELDDGQGVVCVLCCKHT